MPIPPVRYGFLVVMVLSLAGCYSGGRWSMPDLAFWKTNPFSPSKSTAPDPIPRPTELAHQPGPPPGSGHASANFDTADTAAPPFGGPSSDLASRHQPYPVTQPDGGDALPSYMAPQEGRYDAGSNDPSRPGGVAAFNTRTSPQTGAAVPHGTSPPSNHALASNPYAGRGGSGSPTPYPVDTGAGSQGHGIPPGYVSADPSGPYANPVRRDPQESYDAQLADYRNTAGMYGSAIPDYRGGSDHNFSGERHQAPPSADRSRPGDHPAYAPDMPHTPAGTVPSSGYGTNTPHGYYPPSGAGQADPNAWQDRNHSPEGHHWPAGGYSPGNTGYQPSGVPPYEPPGGASSSDARAFHSEPGYSPGSVSRYEPWQE